MKENNNLTTGPIGKTTIRFVLPYLLSCFMQTFYGLADLFVVGLYNGPATTTAVSIGSQIMHMLTVMLVGLAMGVTVRIGQAEGAGDKPASKNAVGTAAVFFAAAAVVITGLLIALVDPIARIMMTPAEALTDTKRYLLICFAGVPFITAYNMISSIFRGAGDSKRPMCFVAAACVVNVLLDFVFVGGLGMGAAGAALATVLGQAASVAVSLAVMKKQRFGFVPQKQSVRINKSILTDILKVGVPVACQDGLIQVAFIIITIIANSRGLVDASGVGIVEKLISFMFLVPSAFLSAISAITAQNMGAGKPERARAALRYSLMITVAWGCLCWTYNQFLPHTLVGLFSRDAAVVAAGAVYLRSYSADCIFAAVHFCFSGYFCGDNKSVISFIHNISAIILVRIPGAYLASRMFPDTLYPMGMAAPLGSLFSALICIGFYVCFRSRERKTMEG